MENRLLHGLVDISAYYVQWLRITTCFIYTEWCWGAIYTVLDTISLVVKPSCPRNHSMYWNCSFLILVFLFLHNSPYNLFTGQVDWFILTSVTTAYAQIVLVGGSIHALFSFLVCRSIWGRNLCSMILGWDTGRERERVKDLFPWLISQWSSLSLCAVPNSFQIMPASLWRWRNRVGRELQKGQCQCTVFTAAWYITVHGNLLFRSSFLPWYHITNSDQLCTTLGAAMPNSVLSCKMSPSQIKEMLVQKWEELLQVLIF